VNLKIKNDTQARVAWVLKSIEIKNFVELFKWNDEKCTPIHELSNTLVFVWYNHADKGSNWKCSQVSSLILVLNGFEIVTRKFATFRGGEKRERRKSPILQESNALYASRVWSKCDCLGEYDSHKCDTPKEKE
jgi:hypothetical protein